MPARAALLLLLSFGFVRLTAAEPDEVVSLRLKAEHGNALAQYNLGLAYAEGRHVTADPSEAFAWLSLASENGATGKALDSLLGNISDAQLAEGRRRLATYHLALANHASTVARSTPKLAPRGFTVDARPVTPAAVESPTPLTKAPEAAPPPLTTTPGEGTGTAALAQARGDLAKSQADLQGANHELAALRASVTRLEAEAATAKATETRLLAELKAAQHDPATSKPVADTLSATEKTQSENSPPHQP